MGLNVTKVEFKNSRGDLLIGRLDTPDDSEIYGYAIFAHCFACSKDIPAAARIARELAALGIGVLRFDFTGLGSSGGEFEDTNFSSNIEDLIAASEYLEANYAPACMLVGHSLGGAAVLHAASSIPSSKAIVTIGAPFAPSHVKHHFSEHIEEIHDKGAVEVELAGIKRTISAQFIQDLDNQTPEEMIGGLNRALLIFHSPTDTVVPIEEARAIYLAAKHPKSFISLDSADHLLTNKLDSEYVANIIVSWSKRFILEI